MTVPEPTVELARLRASIDARDVELVRVLASRFALTRKVGVLKATHKLPPKDPVRETEHIAHLREIAKEARLDPEFVSAVFQAVMAQVVQEHEAGRDATR